MATKLNGLNTMFEYAFDEWIGNAEPDDDFTTKVDFLFDYFVNYEAVKDHSRYDADKEYLIIVEPPRKWSVLEPDANQTQCEKENELVMYIIQRGIKFETMTGSLLMSEYSDMNDCLLEWLAALKYWAGKYIRIYYPADVNFLFDNTVNKEITLEAKFKVNYY